MLKKEKNHKKLKRKIKMHKVVLRKIIHLCFGLFILLLYYLDFYVLEILSALLIIGIIFSLTCKQYKLPLIYDLLKLLGKNKEFYGLGMLIFCFSGLFLYAIFPRLIAFSAIFVLAVADSIGAVIGVLFGKIQLAHNPEKHIEGRLIAFFICVMVLSFIFGWFIATITSFIAILVESTNIKLKKINIDDNLLMPLVTAITLYILTIIL
jgi:dolichol kinase